MPNTLIARSFLLAVAPLALAVGHCALNARAYVNPEELIGAPQNPRRLTLGFDLRFD
jgi:hypothetical protein